MTKLEQMQAVEDRAFNVRKTVGQLCDLAGVYPSVWSRAKSRGTVSIDVIVRMERALDRLETKQ